MTRGQGVRPCVPGYRSPHPMTLTDHAQEIHELPPGLWERLRKDPLRSPEHIALAAAAQFGPHAARWAADKRARFQGQRPRSWRPWPRSATPPSRRFEARDRNRRRGDHGPRLAMLAWIQSRLVFYIAAAYGYDPTEPMRPAEALVVFGFYPDPATARRALDGIGSTVVEAYIG